MRTFIKNKTPEVVYLKGKNHTVLVDKQDLERIGANAWHSRKKGGYVCRQYRDANGALRSEMMHQLIMGETPKGMSIDHINRMPWDNRRDNLRFATHSEQMFNRAMFSGSTGFRGVRRHSRGGFVVYVGATSSPGSYRGYFKDIEKAIAARSRAIRRLGVIV